MTTNRFLPKATWFLLKWGLLLGLAAGVFALAYYYQQIDEGIRRYAEKLLASHYSNLDVRIRSAQHLPGEGIKLHGVTIRQKGAGNETPPMVEIEQLDLHCQGTLDELLTGQLNVRAITVRHPRVRAVRGADGTWNLSALLPLPKFSDRPPPLQIENGTLEIVEPRQGPGGTLPLRDVNLRLWAIDGPEQNRRLRRMVGTCTGDFLRRIDIDGTFDPATLQGAVSGSIDGLEISPELRSALPAQWAAKLAPLSTLRTQAVLAFRVFFKGGETSEVRFDVSGQFSRGRLDDPRLPHPLTDIHGRFRCDNEGLTVEDLVAYGSQATLRVHSLHLRNFDPARGLWLDARVQNLALHPQWLDLVPFDLKSEWAKYQPEGHVNVHVRLTSLPDEQQLYVRMEAIDVAFTHYRFPYRLSQTSGALELVGDRLSIDLNAQASGRPVTITGEIRDPLTAPHGILYLEGSGIVLDDKLITALPSGKAQEVVRSLHPQGAIDCRFWLEQPTPQGPQRKYLEVDLRRCSVRYDRFPYPIGDITGQLVMEGDDWFFNNLKGSNDTGEIACRGSLVCRRDSWDLELGIEAENIPLEAELRDALPQQRTRQLWNDLRPQGAINLNARVRYESGWPQAVVTFTALPYESTVSIEPVYFPYRMENIEGQMHYKPGLVQLPKLRAWHGDTLLESTAACRLGEDGSWRLKFDDLWIDRIRLDRSLLNALPEKLADGLEQLGIDRPVNVHGKLVLSRGPHKDAPCHFEWDVETVLVQAAVDCGLPMENVHGAIRLAGTYDGNRFVSNGRLAIDAARYDGMQLTNVRGPIRITDSGLLFGINVDPQNVLPAGGRVPPQRPVPISGKMFGGTFYASGRLRFDTPARYDLTLSLTKADLPTAVREAFGQQNSLRGELYASVKLEGTGRDISGMSGYGNFQLRRADIYELPVMISLLKILSVKEVDRTAFSDSDARFRIAGRHLYLDELNFRGDAISLSGRGEVDLDGHVQLTFRSMLGRHEIEIPVIREFFRGASEQIVLVHVGGTLRDPIVRREAFPGVNQALQMFQGGISEMSQQPRAPASPRF